MESEIVKKVMDEETKSNDIIHRQTCKDINEHVDLQFLLMDANLMPEQVVKGTDQWRYMVVVACAYRLGQESMKQTEALQQQADQTAREA